LKHICRIVAGSRLYGIDTPDSDLDTRGVFLNTSPADILGLSRREVVKSASEDTLFLEFRHYLGHLRKTNTFALELLFADGFDLITDEFRAVRENKTRLIDSERLFHSLIGYIHNERRLANGERTGELGGKRKTHVEKYGFSPKNFSHLLRLAHCGEFFYKTSTYPVNLNSTPFRDIVFSVKTDPDRYTREQLNLMADEAVASLRAAYEARADNFVFDLDLANRMCLDFHLPFLRGG
jgi:predicted nucleotidyltransferase